MSILRQSLREPLVHFVLAGVVLYGAYALLREPGAAIADDTVIVDRRALLTFMQYRANAFEPELFNAALDGMTDDELDELIDDYVTEEVLYREARSLQLESSDYIIRQRMVQKMNFLMSDIADSASVGDDSALRTYFETNIDAYAIAPWTTFTHVFLDGERHGPDAASAAASLRDELNARGAGFNDAPGYGDRFPFLSNYVERTYEYVASHFGYEFAAALADLPASASRWQGPLRSALGEHIVLVTRQSARALPQLQDVRDEVERDFIAERSKAAIDALTDSIREQYRVEIRNLRAVAP